MIKFSQKLFNTDTNKFLNSESHSEWQAIDSDFKGIKTSGSSTFIELNEIDITTNITVYKNEILYLINEITIAKSKNDNLSHIETIGFHALKLQAKF